MNAKGTLVETLTNLLARAHVGRMDEHRISAQFLVDEVLHEEAERLRQQDWCPSDEEGVWEAARFIDPYKEG